MNTYQFGRIQVTCEGYDYPDDPYILKGSCGVRAVYTVIYLCVHLCIIITIAAV